MARGIWVSRRGKPVTRPAVRAGLAATMLLGVFAVPATALRSGPEDVTQLPPSSQGRIAFEEITKVMGVGWATPYTVTLASSHGAITTPALIAAVDRLQQRIAQDQAVSSVTGPGQVDATAKQLQSFGAQLKHSASVSDQQARPAQADQRPRPSGRRLGEASGRTRRRVIRRESAAQRVHTSRIGSRPTPLRPHADAGRIRQAPVRSGLGPDRRSGAPERLCASAERRPPARGRWPASNR